MNGVKPECLGDGVCTNPRCERHGIKDTPVVTDEAVEAAAKALRDRWTIFSSVGALAYQAASTALEAAAPLMGATPQPALDRYRVMEVLKLHTIECTGPGEVTCSACRDKSWMSWFEYRRHVAAELEQAVRPLPTREQIAEAIHGPFCQASRECSGAQPNDYLRADMVLKLFTGGKE